MITLPKKCYISFITKDYLYLANKLIQSVKLFSNFPLVIYTYNFDHDFGIENIYSVRINDESIQKPLFVHSTEENLGIVDRFDFNTFYNLTRKFEVVLQSLNNGISDGIFLDCDVIVNNNIDELFNNFDKIENYPLITKGIFEYMIFNGKGNPFAGQDVLEKPLMDLLNVKDRSMHYVQTNIILFNEKCRDFFEECKKITFDINIIKNPTSFAPFQDETIINVLLWKYQAKNQLPLQYFNLIDENQLKYFFETNCENSYYNGCWWHYFPANKSDVKYFHGCKNEKILSECINFLKNKFKKKKIAFVTLFDGNYQELAKYSIPNKIAYAKKNNYDFYYFDNIIDSSKPPQWNKILAIQKILEKGIYDWVWWIDIDSLILNFDIKLESIIDENYEMIFTQNTYSYISSGSCFFKNTDLVKNFLVDVYYLRKDYLKDLNINIFDHEQQAIRLILQKDETYKNITKLIHERVCNSYCPTKNPDVLYYYPNWNNDDNLYQPNDFLIQFCGRNMEERIVDFNKYMLSIDDSNIKNNIDPLDDCLICINGYISTEEKRRYVYDLLNELKKENLKVCYLTHCADYLDEISKIADYVVYDKQNFLIHSFDYTTNIKYFDESRHNEGSFYIDMTTPYGRYNYYKISEHSPAVLNILKSSTGFSFVHNFKWTIYIEYDIVFPLKGFRSYFEEKINELERKNKKALLYSRSDYEFIFPSISFFQSEKLMTNKIFMQDDWSSSVKNWIKTFNLSFSEKITEKIFRETFSNEELCFESISEDAKKYWNVDNYYQVAKFTYDNKTFSNALVKIFPYKKNNFFNLCLFIDNYCNDILTINKLIIKNKLTNSLIFNIYAHQINNHNQHVCDLNKNLFNLKDTVVLECEYKFKNSDRIYSFLEEYDLNYIETYHKYFMGISLTNEL
jgi:hypothetical protein